MRLSLGSIVLVALVAAIIALVAINAWFLWSPQAKQNDYSFYRSFAQKNHQQMQEALADARESLQKMDENSFVGDAAKKAALLNAFNESALSDVEWLAAQESPIFEKLSKTENNLEALELMKEEVASFVTSGYVFLLNSAVIKAGMLEFFDENTSSGIIEEAWLSAKTVEVRDVLNDELALSLVEETMLQKEQVEQAVKDAFAAYLEKRKKAFSGAPKGSMQEFVEAKKLLELAYLLESQ
jgi:hypothetical protein